MGTETLTNIVIGIVGFVFVTMFSVLGWFLVGTFKGAQEQAKKNTEALEGVSLALRDLTQEFKYSKLEVQQIHKEYDERLDAANKRIDERYREERLTRARFHWVRNVFTALLLQAQAEGWKVSTGQSFPEDIGDLEAAEF